MTGCQGKPLNRAGGIGPSLAAHRPSAPATLLVEPAPVAACPEPPSACVSRETGGSDRRRRSWQAPGREPRLRRPVVQDFHDLGRALQSSPAKDWRQPASGDIRRADLLISIIRETLIEVKPECNSDRRS